MRIERKTAETPQGKSMDWSFHKERYLRFVYRHLLMGVGMAISGEVTIHLLAMKAARFDDKDIWDRIGDSLTLMGFSDLQQAEIALRQEIERELDLLNEKRLSYLRTDTVQFALLTYRGLQRMLGRENFLQWIYDEKSLEELLKNKE